MATPGTNAMRRLLVWGETPELRLDAEQRLLRTRSQVTPFLATDTSLVETIRTLQPDGIVFAFSNINVLLEVLRSIEGKELSCTRFVICPRQHEAAFDSWMGLPPSVLKTDDSPEAWSDKLQRSLLMHRWLMNPEFAAVLPLIRNIPSLPEAHRRIIEVLRDPYCHVDQVATLISRDIALTAQLLKLVNSAALGLAHPISTVPEAVSFIGLSRVQALVMSAWAFFFSSEKPCRGFNPEAEWKHALAVAEATQHLARQLHAENMVAEEAFTAGILHDVGKVLQAANTPDSYSTILGEARKQNKAIWLVEREHLGYTHAELGGCMLGKWGLDLPVVEAVAWHHQPDLTPDTTPTIRGLVYRANCQVHESGDKE